MHPGRPQGGSSPRVWGTRASCGSRQNACWFIPTRVGNTAGFAGWVLCGPVHPHACGEHVFRHPAQLCQVGSSPRVWGTRLLPYCMRPAARFIPTRVGNTSQTSPRTLVGTVHPHACGEHKHHISPDSWQHGSSPRVWGTPTIYAREFNRLRFIPTRVGNTADSPTNIAAQTVHPHACGEHTSRNLICVSFHGSSPRVWGTHIETLSRARKNRFIPTRVGNTGLEKALSVFKAVHPHACGEHGECVGRYR